MARNQLFVMSLLLSVQLVVISTTYPLADYDHSASSSSFGEPVFRLEPPNVINFDNSKGATILCLASGSPKPSISWYTSGSDMSQLQSWLSGGGGGGGDQTQLQTRQLVNNITNLRYIMNNGAAIRLLPFKESDFRQDVHSNEYRCVASNQVATIHSRSVLVQAGNKLTAFKSGELHVQSVDLVDLQRTYGCKLRNSVTNKILASSNLAQLIATDQLIGQLNEAQSTPQVLHSISQLIAWDSLNQLAELNRNKQQDQEPVEWRLLLPCAIRANKLENQRWFYQQTGSADLVPLEEYAANRSIPISHLQLAANGTFARPIDHQRSQRTQKGVLVGLDKQTKLVIGASFVAIEWPRRAQSGRYVCQLAGKTMCDMNVIIRQPIKVVVRVNDTPSPQTSPQEMVGNYNKEEDTLFSRAVDWLSPRSQRHAPAPVHRAVQVRGQAHVKPPPVFSVGQRLQLDCLGSGFPIEGVRWFRNGQPLSAQNSQDFQLEISLAPEASHAHLEEDGADQVVLSSLVIRQLQPKQIGLSMFECFVHNALGEQARAGQLVLIADQSLLDSARAGCPLREGVASGAPELEPEPDDDNLFEEFEQSSWPSEFKSNKLANLIKRHNPFKRALLLESEPAELICPTTSINSSGRSEWRRWTGESDMSRARNFNQLFSGDSRFVINGSSLQIRSPSKRHDEALYACKCLQNFVSSSSADSKQSSSGSWKRSPLEEQRKHTFELEVHQSSFASSCDSLLNRALFAGARHEQEEDFVGEMSSIRIRIVAKPKIDPFELSRNLEEGMRAVAVCAVLSGQSPVELTWFKDGHLLIPDEQLVSLDQANGFSSSLTFHRIQPTHSGYYTCVAANAFGAVNHTSRLLVNVAPYFIEAPKSSKAVLGANLLVNCRAGGQPNPQIRWRKLVAFGSKAAPSGGDKPQFDSDFQHENQAALLAPNNANSPVKSEFRVVTSNSHIQILENGSMIIKELELGDASRYVCQAFNGISPSLSEVIDVQVLSPPQFEVNYETISVKRDSMIKFNCAPKGDQPMAIEWRKEGNLLTISSNSSDKQSKYSELAHFANEQTRHSPLIVQLINANWPLVNSSILEPLKSSELLINYADRADTGNFICVARNAFGKDELTYRLIVQEPPDAPANVQVQNIQSTSLKLVWSAPFDGNLALTHYVIEYRRLYSSTQPEVSSQTRQTSDWLRLVLNKSANELTSNGSSSIVLRQLQPKSAYQIRVAAVNAFGQSAFCAHLNVITAEEPPNSRPNDVRSQPISSGAIKVLWRGPAIQDEQAPIKGYSVSHRLWTAQTSKEEQWLASSSISASNVSSEAGLRSQQSLISNQLASVSNYEFLIAGLNKDTKYEIRVQPYNSMGSGPSSETIGQTLRFDRPNQPILKLISARHHSLELKWTLAISDQEPLMGFSLFYKCEYDDWQEIQLAIVYHYEIENLRCGNKYQIYLSAFNAIGRSEPSDVLSVRTEGSVPVAPDKSHFVRPNISQVVLDLSTWQSGGCPINSFTIQFKRRHETNWFVLSEGATPFSSSDKITVPELTPASWYKLLVSAVNEAGSTNAEYLFATLTLQGDQIEPAYPPGSDSGWLLGVAPAGQSVWSALSQVLFASTPNKRDSQLLLPISCILLLMLGSLATYLYHNRPARASTASYPKESYSGTRPNIREDVNEKRLIDRRQLTLDGACNGSGSGSDQQQQGILDSLLAGSANLQSFVAMNQQRAPQAEAMKLLTSSNLFHNSNASNCASSSISTHSTNCGQFEGSSTSSGSCNKTSNKLQLIDESCMMQSAIEESLEQFGLIANKQLASNADMQLTPTHNLYSQHQHHVDLINKPEELIETATHYNPNEQQLYGFGQTTSGQRSFLSSSFASATDLLQRQQQQIYFQQQQARDEPIYQRLDKFQAYNLPANKSQTLRFSDRPHLDNKSMTIGRRAHLESEPEAAGQYFYHPVQQLQLTGQTNQGAFYEPNGFQAQSESLGSEHVVCNSQH